MAESSPFGIEQFTKLITDGYDRKARLYPGLLLLMPIAVVISCGLGPNLTPAKTVCGVVASCGGLLLLSQLARDSGKRKERDMFQKWGGMPSISIFRHRDGTVDAITKARYHQRMATLVKGTKAPSSEEELADPDAADQVYAAWSTYIRVNTRDTKKYPLLFQENISYGYRRNVWGLRPVGITTTGLSAVCALIWEYLVFKSTGKVSSELAFAGIFASILLLLWIFQFTAGWVRLPANAYAERLVEAVDTLTAKREKK
ncbi:MAG: hypothetical protein ABSF28_22275 [Terracidiphilus sp.]